MTTQANLFVIAALLVDFGLVGSPAHVGADYEQAGPLYIKECQVCHGVKGDGEFAPAFQSHGFWKKNSEAEMAEMIKEERGAIPAFELCRWPRACGGKGG